MESFKEWPNDKEPALHRFCISGRRNKFHMRQSEGHKYWKKSKWSGEAWPRFQGEVSEYITRKGVGFYKRRLFMNFEEVQTFRYGQHNDFVLVLLGFDPISHLKAIASCSLVHFITIHHLFLELFYQPQRKSIHRIVTSILPFSYFAISMAYAGYFLYS